MKPYFDTLSRTSAKQALLLLVDFLSGSRYEITLTFLQLKVLVKWQKLEKF